jgi:hypothetical protein
VLKQCFLRVKTIAGLFPNALGSRVIKKVFRNFLALMCWQAM